MNVIVSIIFIVCGLLFALVPANTRFYGERPEESIRKFRIVGWFMAALGIVFAITAVL